MFTPLQQYAEHYKQKLAHERIMKDLKKEALKELKTFDGGKTNLNSVELHVTSKLREVILPKDIQDMIEGLQSQIADTKKNADAAGKVKYKYSTTFDASIPKSVEEKVLAEASETYKKHFKIK